MDSTLARLAEWMPHQRWYAAKGRAPSLRLVGAAEMPERDAARPRILLLADDASTPPVLYQVPVVQRPAHAAGVDQDRVIAVDDDGDALIDGVYDDAFTAALYDLVTTGGEVGGAVSLRGSAAASAPPVAPHARARVLTGEQSNTSLIYRSDDGAAPVICKVFRQVQPGVNPDIELQTALADAGSPYVPAAVGWVEGEWHDAEHGRTTGSLAFAQEFLPGVEDAWRVALTSAGAAEDFTARARDLGVATAEVHVSLARRFPTRTAARDDRDGVSRSWQQRLDAAIAEVPDLSAHREDIEAVYRSALAAQWPPLQRVHGDYHLGQVLLVPDRGWVLLDFEGEPLRPMSERVEPDLSLRDVAGMLRSFDYVAGSIGLDRPQDATAARDWARDARAAFLAGYEDTAATEVAGPLLDALELDKAVYEVIYESRNRPSWVPIPSGAIERLARPGERR